MAETLAAKTKRVKRAKQRKDSFGRKASSLSKAVGDATERQRVRHAKAAPAAARRLVAVHAGWGARLAAADVAWRHRQRWWHALTWGQAEEPWAHPRLMPKELA